MVRHYNLAEKPIDTTTVHIPSKLFWFIKLETDIVTSKDQKVKNCAIYIEQPSQKVRKKFGKSSLDILRTLQADKEDDTRLTVEKQSYETGVFVTMHREATIPLTGMPGHNSHLNWYDHFRHYNFAEKPLDTTAVHIPSKLFWFTRMETDIAHQVKSTSKDQKVQDCVIYIEQPSKKVTKNLLSICQTICQVQLISDLFVNKVSGRHRTEDDTYVMSTDAQTVWIHQCNFTLNFWQYFLSSLSATRNLTTLDLSHVILGNAGRDLATSVQAWGPSSPIKTLILCDVSITVPDWGKLCESLVVCQNLTHLNLSQNILGQSGRQLACSMQSWGFHLEIANFEGCCVKADACRDIIKHLSRCKELKILNLSGNTLSGCLPNFLKDPYPGLALLRTVKLNECELNRDDIVHMTSLVNRGQLPALVRLQGSGAWPCSGLSLLKI